MGRTYQNLDAFAASVGVGGPLLSIEQPDRSEGGSQWSIATPRSASTCAARAAIAIAISMAGERKRPVPPWSSAAALKMLSVLIFEERTAARLFTEWGAYRDAAFEYKKGETWDRMLHQGVHLLGRFAQDNRIRIAQPQDNLQIKTPAEPSEWNEFVSYIDAIGELDGQRCLIDWKTTTSRYTEGPRACFRLIHS